MDTKKQAKLAYMDMQIIHRQLWAQYWMTEAIVFAQENKFGESQHALNVAKSHIKIVEETGDAKYSLMMGEKDLL